MVKETTTWRAMLVGLGVARAFVSVKLDCGRSFEGEVFSVGADYVGFNEVADAEGSIVYVPFTALSRVVAPRRRPEDLAATGS
jgi:hypothetical protein